MEGQVPEVERAIRALYGARPLATRGVLHVPAARAEGPLRVLRIGEGAPKSETDFFVLNLCRARCDAILTTAENLRREPGLRHDLQGSAAAPLAAYRREVLKKSEPPLCAVLTRSGDLPAEHAVWSDWTRKVVLSGQPLSAEVRERFGSDVACVHLDGLDARAACAWLRDQGAALVSVEAGPSTAGTLYGADSVVDELLLSLYEGDAAVPLGGALPVDVTGGLRCTADVERAEASGRWRFQRWARDVA